MKSLTYTLLVSAFLMCSTSFAGMLSLSTDYYEPKPPKNPATHGTLECYIAGEGPIETRTIRYEVRLEDLQRGDTTGGRWFFPVNDNGVSSIVTSLDCVMFLFQK